MVHPVKAGRLVEGRISPREGPVTPPSSRRTTQERSPLFASSGPCKPQQQARPRTPTRSLPPDTTTLCDVAGTSQGTNLDGAITRLNETFFHASGRAQAAVLTATQNTAASTAAAATTAAAAALLITSTVLLPAVSPLSTATLPFDASALAKRVEFVKSSTVLEELAVSAGLTAPYLADDDLLMTAVMDAEDDDEDEMDVSSPSFVGVSPMVELKHTSSPTAAVSGSVFSGVASSIPQQLLHHHHAVAVDDVAYAVPLESRLPVPVMRARLCMEAYDLTAQEVSNIAHQAPPQRLLASSRSAGGAPAAAPADLPSHPAWQHALQSVRPGARSISDGGMPLPAAANAAAELAAVQLDSSSLQGLAACLSTPMEVPEHIPKPRIVTQAPKLLPATNTATTTTTTTTFRSAPQHTYQHHQRAAVVAMKRIKGAAKRPRSSSFNRAVIRANTQGLAKPAVGGRPLNGGEEGPSASGRSVTARTSPSISSPTGVVGRVAAVAAVVGDSETDRSEAELLAGAGSHSGAGGRRRASAALREKRRRARLQAATM